MIEQSRVNVQIVRIFVRIREMLAAQKGILRGLEKLESKVLQHDGDIKLIFKYLKELLDPRTEPVRKIGFKRSDEA